VASELPISVVTPFYNTADYLAEAIESVLRQSRGDFEYLLVDNRSTDGSREIAERYARLDPRVRVVENPRFVGQVENYNGALAQVSPAARWVKVLQADDALFPTCLERMVELGERHPSVALVSSRWLNGEVLVGGDAHVDGGVLDGREAVRLMLLRPELALLGSPTTVLYRAERVRARQPFYASGRLHEDTEAGYDLLLEGDLGFVPETLSFSRTANASITSAARRFNPWVLDHYIEVATYGPRVLEPGRAAALRAELREGYFRFLGRASLLLLGKRFWAYQRDGLATVGEELRFAEVLRYAAREIIDLAAHPLKTGHRAMEKLRWELRSRRGRGRVLPPGLR
jgi:glycosyltransferase involved in cell wall biosynthesis